MNNKPLRRIQSEAVLGGVAAGLADYFGMDKALMRVIFVILMIFAKGFPVILLYIILWVALPKAEPTVYSETNWETPNVTAPKKDFNRGAEFIGYALLLIGGIMLFDRLFYWMHLQKFVPAAILIGIGLFLILRSNGGKSTTTIADSEPATPSWTDSAPINEWQPPKSSDPTEPSGETDEPKA